MISRRLKVKPNATLTRQLDGLLWQYAGVYNWAVRKLYQDGRGGVFYSRYDLYALVNGHADRCGLNTNTMRAVLRRAYDAHYRRKDRSKPARMKGQRNRFASLPLTAAIRWVDRTHVQLPGVGRVKVRPGKDFPAGPIKGGVLERRAGAWYLTLIVDGEARPVPITGDAVAGVDFGFKQLATLSTGEVIANPREYDGLVRRMGQAQRGRNHRLVARLHRRLANARRVRNHLISRDLIGRRRRLYLSRDSYRGMARTFGRSVHTAAIGQFISMLHAKGRAGGREVIEVSNINSTRTCADCGSLTGPTGLAGLRVRTWDCGACGAHHDRDVNAAMNALKVGAVLAPEMVGDHLSEIRSVPDSPSPQRRKVFP